MKIMDENHVDDIDVFSETQRVAYGCAVDKMLSVPAFIVRV